MKLATRIISSARPYLSTCNKEATKPRELQAATRSDERNAHHPAEGGRANDADEVGDRQEQRRVVVIILEPAKQRNTTDERLSATAAIHCVVRSGRCFA